VSELLAVGDSYVDMMDGSREVL